MGVVFDGGKVELELRVTEFRFGYSGLRDRPRVVAFLRAESWEVVEELDARASWGL